MQKLEIQNVIIDALNQINAAREADDQLEVAPGAPIYGPGSPLDSLGLVSVILEVEEALRQRGVTVSLSDERAISQRRSPFRDVPSLTEFIEASIQQNTP